MPDEWFVTFSGIPLGVMSEMLQDGGNRFLGMVYGTTARHSYSQYSPAPVWKLWKDFNIQNSEMLGYWDKDCPVKTNHPKVKATAFVKPGEVLISVGNFDSKNQAIKLDINWNQIKINPQNVTLESPYIQNFQQKETLYLNDFLLIPSKEGRLIILKENELTVSDLPDITCYPNPFSNEITMEFRLSFDAKIDAKIYNHLGQQVKTLSSKQMLTQGTHHLTWNGENDNSQKVPTGVYHLRLTVNGSTLHRKIILS